MLHHQQTQQSEYEEVQEHAEHDILASIAIANGLISTLELCHAELHESYQDFAAELDSDLVENRLDMIEKHARDSQFCLLRLAKSMQMLEGRFKQAYGKAAAEKLSIRGAES